MNDQFSFEKGWGQIPQKDIKDVREKLMDALSINTLQAFRRRVIGTVEPKITEAQAIERIFGEYGITEIWGK